MNGELTREILAALAAELPADEVEFLPKAPRDNRALALAYHDARSVMNRLDAVVGPGGWSFDYDLLSPDGKKVKGKLTVLGVTKCDAGEADKEDEPLKSAVSDALKRAGVQFGIGRYLYYLPQVWAPYDQQKRRFTEPVKIPREAVAKALAICGAAAGTAPKPAPVAARVTQTLETAPSYAAATSGDGNGSEPALHRTKQALQAEFAAIGIGGATDEEKVLRQRVAGKALDRPSPKISGLLAKECEDVAAWIRDHRADAEAFVAELTGQPALAG